jgi:hypothetical protein
MSEREQTPDPYGSRSAHDSPTQDLGRNPADDWREQTTPGVQPVGSSAVGGSYGYGGPGQADAPTQQYSAPQQQYSTSPQYSAQPVKVRRPDALAALLLILAGLAAGLSLVLDWLPGKDTRGWDVLQAAWDGVRDNGFRDLFDSGFWQPVAVIAGGAVLFVLGLLMLVPARAHRFLGLLGLLVSLAAAAGVLVPLADNGWDLGEFRVGFYVAMAVPVLGLLGSLKALLTGPKRAPATAPATTY